MGKCILNRGFKKHIKAIDALIVSVYMTVGFLGKIIRYLSKITMMQLVGKL